MIILKFLAYFLFGAAAGRIRGSDLLPNDTVARFGVWGCSVGLLVLHLTHNWVYGVVSIICAGLGASIGYWGQFDLTVAPNRTFSNYGKLTLTAMARFAPLCIAAIYPGLWLSVLPAVLSGVLFVPSYYLAIFTYKYTKNFNLGPLFNQFTCFGEFYFWGIIYLALALGLTFIN